MTPAATAPAPEKLKLQKSSGESVELSLDEKAKKLQENTFEMVVIIGRPGETRGIDVEDVYEGEADKTMLRAQKKILKSPEYKAVKKLDGKFRNDLKRLSTPSDLKTGIYRVSVGLFEEVDDLRMTYEAERAKAVQLAKDTYEKRVAESIAGLKELASPNDYLDKVAWGDQFYVKIAYRCSSVPDMLKRLSKDVYQREAKNMFESIKDNVRVAEQSIRTAYAELVDDMLERLEPDADGRKKTFRDSLIAKWSQFIQRFPHLNVTGDTDLEKLVSESTDLLSGVTATRLRSDDEVRERIQEGFNRIKETLAAGDFVVKKPKRWLGDDDDE